MWCRNYRSILDQVKLLGFNVLRIPFCHQSLIANESVKSINFSLNSDLVGLTPLETLDRIVAYCGIIGLRIFLDRHSALADAHFSEALWYIPGDLYYTDARFIEDWVMLATRYRDSAVIGADLFNEPKKVGDIAATWGTDDLATDWKLAAQRAGNAILSVNPDWLIIVTGTGQNTWWGGNLMGVLTSPVILSVPNKLVYSVHEYCQDVYDQAWFSEPTFPSNLRPRWDIFWGYIFRTEMAPIIVGEFGTKFAYSNDAVWLRTLLNYMDGELEEDGVSSLRSGQLGVSWTFWCLNPNSGDTGGILMDDWETVDSYKMAFLTPYLAPPRP